MRIMILEAALIGSGTVIFIIGIIFLIKVILDFRRNKGDI